MPYVVQEIRSDLFFGIRPPANPAQLNYIITQLVANYWADAAITKTQNYQKINDIIGALEGAKMEFYRRVAVPYEESKIKENGDVY